MRTKDRVAVLHASKAARRRLRVEGDTMCVASKGGGMKRGGGRRATLPGQSSTSGTD